ncbi:hypothetical protein KSF_046850 [Reticulibacter mediterranei]|uniref:Uncharacterized protein n=1 Tax=Reticulibacter mediterranei TaxID=2778369 RepID=A0A8J3N505_9CHLR|nr:hypothetical protein KSF_046850 [Reticulibacter mediterranei]
MEQGCVETYISSFCITLIAFWLVVLQKNKLIKMMTAYIDVIEEKESSFFVFYQQKILEYTSF